MERIDLFDRYFNGELSEGENIKFKERLGSDEDFSYDFKIYSMIVAGIYKEAEQDNADFGAAMQHLSREQLFEIIGRKPRSINREDIINRLQSRIVLVDRVQKTGLSGAAAFDEIDDDDYSNDNQEDNSVPFVNNKKNDSGNSLRFFTFIFFAIVILLIIISILLF